MAKEEKVQAEQNLNDIFGQLEDVIAGLEAEDISLEDSFRLYHSGMDMLKACNDKIEKIEKKMLVLDEEGEAHEF